MKKSKKNRWAMVGLGLQAEKIAAAIKNSKNNELVAVADKNKSRAKEFAKIFGIKSFFNSYSGMLRQKDIGIDAVFIASANFEHAKQSLLALKYKKHVLCEKPMALSEKEGLMIKKEVLKNHLIFKVGFHLRYHPLIQEAKKIIKSGKLGKIVLIEMNWSAGRPGEKILPPLNKFMKWREDIKKSGGGAIMARGIHLFDLLRFITNQEIKEISAYTDNASKNRVETLSLGILKINDIFAAIATSRRIPYSRNDAVIYGSNGRIILHDAFAADGSGTMELREFNGHSVKKKLPKKINLYQKEIEGFYKNNCAATADDGLKNIIITKAFLNSARRKKSVSI